MKIQIASPIRIKLRGIATKAYAHFGRTKRARYTTTSALVIIATLIGMLTFHNPKAFASSQGPYGSTSVSGSSWTNPNNIETHDSTYASISVASASTGATITAEGFGFSVPTGATINGIEVDVYKYASTGTRNTMEDGTVELLIGGTASGSNLATTTAWPTTNTEVTYGGASTLWGLTPTVAQINGTTFGVELAPKNVHTSGTGAALTAFIDYVQITVTYSLNVTYTQSDYEFYNNANSTTPGSSLAAQNTAITSPGDGVPFRVRQEVTIGTSTDPINGQLFELQYAAESGGSCSATPSANFANVTNSSTVGYYSNSSATNGTTITSSGSDPNDGNTVVYGTYQGSGTTTFSNPTAIPSGEDGMWDFAIVTNDAPAATTYCLRMATNSGGAISGYNQYPQFTTPAATPTQSSYRFFKNQDGTTAGWSTPTSAGAFGGTNGTYGGVSLYFNNKLWYLGGVTTSNTNSVYCSSDGGATWSDSTCGTTSAQWGARSQFAATVFNGKMWIMGGINGSTGTRYHDVWCSTDGTNWNDSNTTGSPLCGTPAAGWAARQGFQAVVFNNEMWVMGGSGSTTDNSEVWCSSDGTTWSDSTCGTSAAPWAARDAFTAYALNNEMYVAGGENAHTSAYYNDVYCTSDGTSWSTTSCGTTSASWSKREGQMGTVYNGLMWLIGGYSSTGSDLNDVYCSSNGSTWTAYGTSPCGSGTAPSWTARDSGAATASPTGMYILGGEDLSGDLKDVQEYSTGGDDVSTPLTSQTRALDLFGTHTGAPPPVTAAPINQPFRLRWNIDEAGSAETKNSLSMNLQYAEMSGGSCSATPSGNFANVSTSTPVQFYTGNTVATNGSTLVHDSNDPTDGSNTINYQDYVTTNPFVNTQSDIPGSQDGLWDFALELAASPPHTTYCLRAVISGTGTPITSGSTYPTIDVAPTPIQLLRGRNWWNSSGVRQFKDLK